MDNEKLPLPKGIVESISSARIEFEKLYASMNTEQIANMIKPLANIAKVVNVPTNKTIQAAASSMIKSFDNPIKIGVDKSLIDAAGTTTKNYAEVMKVANMPPNENVMNSVNSMVEISKLAFEKYNFKAINSITETLQTFLNSFQSTVFKDFSAYIEILKNKNIYTDEELSDIQYNLNILAERGWLVYFLDDELFYNINPESFGEVEEHWIELLESDLNNQELVSRLESSSYIPSVLIQSMIQSYKSENYYAAYTIATIIIDGALNRFAESGNNSKKITVGYKTINIFESEFTNRSLRDSGLIKWLQLFFEDTRKFTLARPNRHMINHGRWEEQINKKEFLKIFNAVLYIEDILTNRISYA